MAAVKPGNEGPPDGHAPDDIDEPRVERTMIMSLSELERVREMQKAKARKSGSLPPPDASIQKTSLATALELPDVPSVEVMIDAFEATRISAPNTTSTIADLSPFSSPSPVPAPEPPAPAPPRAARAPVAERVPLPPPVAEPVETTTLLERFTPDVVLATPLDPAAEFDEEQNVHLLHAPLENGRPSGDMLAWREGALIGAERFVKGVARERLMFHPDGTWAQYYLFDAFGLPRYRGRQKGPKNSPEVFPTGAEIHPKARQIEYLYDDHGGMEAFRCLDEYGDELSREVVSRAADMQTEQAVFDSLEEASARWRSEGAEFKNALNSWLSERYALVAAGEEADWSQGEPSDTRSDMERVVVQAIEQYNAEGRFEELREHFPPAFEPFTPAFWERFSMPVEQVVSLADGGVLISAGRQCYHALDNTITELEGVFAIGRCSAHRFVALAKQHGVEVTDGFEGALVATFAYPTTYGWLSERFPGSTWANLGNPETMHLTQLHVRPDGLGVVLVSAEGIYSLSADESKLLYPQPRQLKGYFENWKTLVQEEGAVPSLEMDFAFAELSPDGSMLACGARLVRGVLAQLEIFVWDEVEWVPKVSSFEKSMFPRLLRFHDTMNQVAFAPVLYATVDTNWSDSMPNTVFRFDRARLNKAGQLKEFDGGLRVAPGIVNSIEPWGTGFLLGMRNQGYLWHMSAEENEAQLGFMHLGGSIDALETSLDKTMLYVGTSCGQVICLRSSDSPDPQLIADLPLTDEKRYLFFRSFSPMVW